MRDAIIAADLARNGGANKCSIWQVFARRGMGANSLTPDPTNALDYTSDFELPTACAFLGIENNTPLNRSLFGQLYYNNPAQAGDIIKFAPAETQNVQILLLNSEGKIVDQLFNGKIEANAVQTMNVKNNLSSGMYFLQINADKFKEARKIIVK
jgi:hypothetical protein